MKTTVELPDELLRQARELARTRGLTLKDLLTEGLRSELARQSSEAPRPGFTFRTVDGSGLQPGIDERRLIDFAYEDPA